jgi:hypothetical protein
MSKKDKYLYVDTFQTFGGSADVSSTPDPNVSTQGFFTSGGWGDMVLQPGETLDPKWTPIWWPTGKAVRNDTAQTLRISRQIEKTANGDEKVTVVFGFEKETAK